MIGKMLGGYRLEEELGSGAFGTVYRARHVDMDWVAAVKVAREQRYGAMIREEGRLLAKLNHPNIVRVHQMDTMSEPPYVVVEYIKGESLAQILRHGPMAPDQVVQMARQVLTGLGAAHDLGVLHRDIKPSNVLIAGDGTAKLADFGLGRAVERESLASSLAGGAMGASMMRSQVSQQKDTEDGGVVGTIAYMAPEQMRGEETDARADLYSLGVVIYEALTGELPVGRFELPGEIVTGVPETLDRLVETMLAPRPARRPKSAAEALALIYEAGATAASPTKTVTPKPTPSAPPAQPIMRPTVPIDRRSWDQPGSHVGEEIQGPDGGTYVWVPAGEFMMGAHRGQMEAQPAHGVYITTGFWLGRCEVTRLQWHRYREAIKLGPTTSDPRAALPAAGMNWTEAYEYCQHYGMRLPTEAEWEYAARGPDGSLYPWVGGWTPDKCCNWNNRAAHCRTFPVGSFPQSKSWCGTMDMAGNVAEWCHDWFDPDYYRRSPKMNPQGPNRGAERVVRGGGWHVGSEVCSSVHRDSADPNLRVDYIGFRCAIDLAKPGITNPG